MTSAYAWETSVVVVSHPDRGVLLVRQNYGPHFFGLPGGTLEEGESPVRAAERELYEETGLRAKSLTAAGTRELMYPRDGSWGSGKRYLAHVFVAEQVTGSPAVQAPEEIASVGWYPIDRLPSPLTPSARAVLVEPGASR